MPDSRWLPGPAGQRPLSTHRLSPVTRSSDRFYLLCFAGIFLTAALARIYWTITLGMPYLTPDSWSYIQPILRSPPNPISEIRTAGYPTLILLALRSFKHPVGILFAHHVLWAVSTLAAALVLYWKFGLRLASLVFLFYLAFAQNNLAFEYMVMSEHLARSVYLLFMSYVLVWSRRSLSWSSVAVASVLTLGGILVKPSGIVLVPASLVFFRLGGALLRPQVRARFWRAALAYLTCVGVGIVAYQSAFWVEYGDFALSHFEGYNLFCHAGHLMDLDSNRYPELMADLRSFMPLYVRKYAHQGKYVCNWLAYGSTNDELEQDFDAKSPARSVREYLISKGITPSIREVNVIYYHLAVDGIVSHPVAYIEYVVACIRELLSLLQTPVYHDYLLGSSLTRNAGDAQAFRDLLEKYLAEGRRSSELAREVDESMARGDWAARYGDGRVSRTLEMVGLIYASLAAAVSRLVVLIGVAALLAAPVALWGLLRKRADARLGVMVAVALTLTAGYIIFLGCFNSSEVRRFVVNVQGIAILGEIGIVACGWQTLRGLRTGARRQEAR